MIIRVKIYDLNNNTVLEDCGEQTVAGQQHDIDRDIRRQFASRVANWKRGGHRPEALYHVVSGDYDPRTR